ncbi:hypothetical protein BRD13_00745 [Halobacteriales archaeon SW_5_70_135]|nr:MAG: hypothetical protein BRD13_00745 [Halobacteriales archaeon SW_5_70_135]
MRHRNASTGIWSGDPPTAGCRGRERWGPVARVRAGNGASEAPDVGGHVAATGRAREAAAGAVDGELA